MRDNVFSNGRGVVNLTPKSKTARYGSNWKQVSSEFRKDKVCSKCGKPARRNDPIQTHHIIAVSQRGRNIPMNFAPMHSSCHAKHHGKR